MQKYSSNYCTCLKVFRQREAEKAGFFCLKTLKSRADSEWEALSEESDKTLVKGESEREQSSISKRLK